VLHWIVSENGKVFLGQLIHWGWEYIPTLQASTGRPKSSKDTSFYKLLIGFAVLVVSMIINFFPAVLIISILIFLSIAVFTVLAIFVKILIT